MKSRKQKTYPFLFYTNLLIVVATLVSAVGSVIDPRTMWLFSFFGLIFHFLVIINLFFIFGWAFKRLRYSLISLVCLLVLHKQVGNSFGFNLFVNKIEQVDSFSVLSYNTSNFYIKGLTKKENAKNRNAAIRFLSKTDPDIICTQESNNTVVEKVMKSLPEYHHYRYKKKGTSIFTKFEIKNKGQIDFSTVTNSCIWVDILVNGDMMRIYSAHLQSNRISSEAEALSKKPNLDRGSMERVKNILKRYKRYNIRRAAQADLIREHIALSPYPVIFCGDLNDTPQSYTYTNVRGVLCDAFLEKGLGLGVSFAGKIPGLRIDYILNDPKLKVLEYNTYDVPYSDHLPILGVLKMK